MTMTEPTTRADPPKPRAKSVLRREDGGIDLPSTMVSILVIAAFLAAAALAVFVVIPWAQNNAAKQLVEQVGSAQSAHYAMSSDGVSDPHYTNLDGLKDKGLLTGVDAAQAGTYATNATAQTDPATGIKDGFATSVFSDTGTEFVATDKDPQPFKNLALNSSFEGSMDKWSAASGYVLPTQKTLSGDTYMGADAVTAGIGKNGFKTDYSIPAGAGERWEITVAHRVTGTINAKINVKAWQSGAATTQSAPEVTPSGTWKVETFTFTTAPATTGLTPSVTVDATTGTGLAVIDHVTIRRVG